MKKIFILTIAAFTGVSAAFAQTSAKDSIAAAKAAAKELKAKQAADLKAFKAKQKEDLQAFIERQNGSKPAIACSVNTKADSVAYAFGIWQGSSLKQYATQRLEIKESEMDSFVDGIISRVSSDPNDETKKAFLGGEQIGSQLFEMAERVQGDFAMPGTDEKIDVKVIAAGIIDALGERGTMQPESAGDFFNKTIESRKEAIREAKWGENRRDGERFLELNKQDKGVVVLPSGLQYKVLTQGTGEKPTSTSRVKVNYEGRLIDGTVFDSSYKRNSPSTFQANQVIKGWTEALQLMPVGSKWELYIPYQLAYGDRETGQQIKPYSALIFVVELLDIEK